MQRDASDATLDTAWGRLARDPADGGQTLRWALDEMRQTLAGLQEGERAAAAFRKAEEICDADVETNRMIGVHGLEIIQEDRRDQETWRGGQIY